VKPTPKPTIETLSLEIAKIVSRERQLVEELNVVKIEKRRLVSMMRNLASGAEFEPQAPRESKKEQVRQFVLALDLGTEITTSQVAESLSEKNNDIISNYLSSIAREGFIKRTGRGKYVVERTMAMDKSESPD
jgi:hypothetical protein